MRIKLLDQRIPDQARVVLHNMQARGYARRRARYGAARERVRGSGSVADAKAVAAGLPDARLTLLT
jgi:hypothetical protein